MKRGRFTFDIKKNFFTLRAMRHLLEQIAHRSCAPSLDVFKARWDGM